VSILEVDIAAEVAEQDSRELMVDAAARARRDRAFRRRCELLLPRLADRRGRFGFRVLGWLTEHSRGSEHKGRPRWPGDDVVRELHSRLVERATGTRER
jgi:hypothetical protein